MMTQPLLLAPGWPLVEIPYPVAPSRGRYLRRQSGWDGWDTEGRWSKVPLGGLHKSAVGGSSGDGL